MRKTGKECTTFQILFLTYIDSEKQMSLADIQKMTYAETKDCLFDERIAFYKILLILNEHLCFKNGL